LVYKNAFKRFYIITGIFEEEAEVDLFSMFANEHDEAEEDKEVDISYDPDNVPVRTFDEHPQIIDGLKRVIDPEVGINIVDLGLVYGIEEDDDTVKIAITMTTPACPLSGVIINDIKDELSQFQTKPVKVGIVWEPPWSHEQMSDAAKQQLGA
jgi:metal-sulfur cluster biosynthetic enzyme